MMRLLAPGGIWFLAGPYTELEHVENCYKVPGADEASRNAPYICRSYSRADLVEWLGATNGEVVEADSGRRGRAGGARRTDCAATALESRVCSQPRLLLDSSSVPDALSF